MSKPAQQAQGAFSFFDEVEKVEPLPKPRRNTLKPPVQVEAEEEAAPLTEENDTDTKAEHDSIENMIPAETTATVLPETLQEQPAQDIIIELSADVNTAEINDTTDNILQEAPAIPTPNQKKNGGGRGRKSTKENELAAELITIPDDETLYQKQYYSMGEVTTMLNESHSLIRYWESEFDILKPRKNGKGDRFFRPVDVKNLYLIYDLLRRRKFTIVGARDYLKHNKKADEKFAAVQSLEKIKSFFLELKASL